ncbi:MAG: flagellar assembly protein FliH [Gammaproteobacteria bacterium]|jgi:flagellar assembly protein FliH
MGSRVRNTNEKNVTEIRIWQAPLVEGHIAGSNDILGKPPSAKQMQALQKDAYDEAYASGRQEGLEKGYEEGNQQAQAKLNAQIVTFQSLLAQLAKPLQKLDDDIENNIVALTIQIARHLVRREMKAAPGEIVAVVREALGVLPVSVSNPRIYLHPEDAEVVRTALSISDDEGSWRIMEDLSMTRGDCRVETESSLIDASVDARLSAIAAKILGGDRGSDRDA